MRLWKIADKIRNVLICRCCDQLFRRTYLNNGAIVFTYHPEQLNAMSNVSRDNGFAGTTTYNPGWMWFAATIGLLTGGESYQVTIAQSAFASAIEQQQVPEPGTLAAIGSGLLAMAALSRRRHR